MITCACLFGLLFNWARFFPTTKITSGGICIQHSAWPSLFWFKFTSVVVGIVYFFFPFLFISTLYMLIFIHLRKLASQKSLNEGQNAKVNTMNKAKTNVLKTLFLLSSCFFLCWCWIIFMLFIYAVGVPVNFDSDFYNFSVFMTNINCCVNPFCYSVQYKEFQEQARRIFCKYKIPSNKPIAATTTNSRTQTLARNKD